MKKINLLVIVVLFLCVSINSFANVKDYIFSQVSGTYTPITGGTVVATATSLSGPGSLDNIIYTLPHGTIPFNFGFNGIPYRGLFISSNGFITFGAPPTLTNYTPISSTQSYAGAISAFGGDNNSLFNISGNTGEIRYEALGSGNNQEFVIQFKNFRPLSSSSSTSDFWRWNFQIRLHIDASIAIVYDANFVGAPTAFSQQVGLRGPDATFATNVNNRLITNGTHTWNTSIDGTATTSTCDASTSNIPASGLQFMWRLPPPLRPNDVGVLSAIVGLPGQIITAGNTYNITATVKNFGSNPQTSVPVYYRITHPSPIGPFGAVYTGQILTNGTVNVIFDNLFAFTPPAGVNYIVEVYTDLPGDQDAGNDLYGFVLEVQGKITSFPYIQTFGDPGDWTILNENVVGTSVIWNAGFLASSHCTNPDGLSYNPAARADFYHASRERKEILRTPEMDFTNLQNPILNFYIAYKTFTNEQDAIEVLVSNDGGLTFFSATTIYNKTFNSVPSLATLPPSTTLYSPANEIEWRHETIILANVAGMNNIVIGFRAVSDFGNNAWIDNVIIDDVDGLCTDLVSMPTTYNCNPLVTLDFNIIGAQPPPQNNPAPHNRAVKILQEDKNNIISFPSVTGNVIVRSSALTDNPSGGVATVSQYNQNDPGQNIIPNISAVCPSGRIFTPDNVPQDFWFTTTYTGNDYNGYANYDIRIDVGGLVFSNINDVYIVKRTDRTGSWVCLNTSLSGGHILTASGLNDFCDIALATSEPCVCVNGLLQNWNFTNYTFGLLGNNLCPDPGCNPNYSHADPWYSALNSPQVGGPGGCCDSGYISFWGQGFDGERIYQEVNIIRNHRYQISMCIRRFVPTGGEINSTYGRIGVIFSDNTSLPWSQSWIYNGGIIGGATTGLGQRAPTTPTVPAPGITSTAWITYSYNWDAPDNFTRIYINPINSHNVPYNNDDSTSYMNVDNICINDLGISPIKTIVRVDYLSQPMLFRPDVVLVSLRSSTSPFSVVDVDTVISVPDSPRVTARLFLENAVVGSSYYVVVNHRNSIETWSANPVTITGDTTTVYDFTTSVSQAFGGNMILVGGVASIYSGDVNQDEIIDASDMSLTDNDAYNFVFGYVNTDVTGDDFVDASDISIIDNNAYNFVMVIRP